MEFILETKVEATSIEKLQMIFSRARGVGTPTSDGPMLDSSFQVHIYSLALPKMLKYGVNFLHFISLNLLM